MRGDEYVVLTGADLADLDSEDVTWAFTGATEKTQSVLTVDMAYVKLAGDPRDTSEYAYVADVNERANNNGHYAEIDVITVNGDTTPDHSPPMRTRETPSSWTSMTIWRKGPSIR